MRNIRLNDNQGTVYSKARTGDPGATAYPFKYKIQKNGFMNSQKNHLSELQSPVRGTQTLFNQSIGSAISSQTAVFGGQSIVSKATSQLPSPRNTITNFLSNPTTGITEPGTQSTFKHNFSKELSKHTTPQRLRLQIDRVEKVDQQQSTTAGGGTFGRQKGPSIKSILNSPRQDENNYKLGFKILKPDSSSATQYQQYATGEVMVNQESLDRLKSKAHRPLEKIKLNLATATNRHRRDKSDVLEQLGYQVMESVKQSESQELFDRTQQFKKHQVLSEGRERDPTIPKSIQWNAMLEQANHYFKKQEKAKSKRLKEKNLSLAVTNDHGKLKVQVNNNNNNKSLLQKSSRRNVRASQDEELPMISPKGSTSIGGQTQVLDLSYRKRDREDYRDPVQFEKQLRQQNKIESFKKKKKSKKRAPKSPVIVVDKQHILNKTATDQFHQTKDKFLRTLALERENSKIDIAVNELDVNDELPKAPATQTHSHTTSFDPQITRSKIPENYSKDEDYIDSLIGSKSPIDALYSDRKEYTKGVKQTIQMKKRNFVLSVKQQFQSQHLDKVLPDIHQSFVEEVLVNGNNIPLPVFNFIIKDSLIISNYQLTDEICKGMSSSMKVSIVIFMNQKDAKFSKLYLIDNSLKDKSLGVIIKSLQEKREVRSLFIRQNEIHETVTKELITLLDKKQVFGLQANYSFLNQLSLGSIKPHFVSPLLMKIHEIGNVSTSVLKRLCLIDTKLDSQQMQMIIPILKNLQSLELRNNNLLSNCIIELFQGLQQAKKFQHFHLSQNLIDPITINVVELDELLAQFIKQNSQLISLNLSNCNFPWKQFNLFYRSIRRSWSLCSLHITSAGTPFDDIDFLLEQIRAKSVMRELQNFETRQKITKQINSKIDQSNKKRCILDSMLIKDLELEKSTRFESKDEYISLKDAVVFNRIIGYPSVSVNSLSQQWCLTHNFDCWVTDGWSYAIFIIDKQLCQKTDLFKNDISQKQRFVQDVFEVQNQTRIIDYINQNRHKQQTFIAGSFNDWRMHSLTSLLDFCTINDKDQNDPIQTLNEKYGMEYHEYKDVESRKHKKEYDQMIKDQRDKWRRDWIDYIKKAYDGPFSQGQVGFSNTSCQFPFISFKDHIDDAHSLFFYFNFVKPGKTPYICIHIEPFNEPISSLSDLEFESTFHRYISQCRLHSLPPKKKQVEQKEFTRKWKKETSIFRDWKEDTPQVLKSCFEHDKQNWKCHRFVKDNNDLLQIEEVIWDNYPRLKDIFIYQASLSKFPCITQLGFSQFCQHCGILDKKVNLATLDRLFIASNVELVDMDDNPNTELCRFEFLEILIRVAGAKYKDQGVVKTYAEALDMLLNENIFPHSLTPQMTWNDFRREELWIADNSDILTANQIPLMKIFQSYHAFKKQFMTQQEAIDLFYKGSGVGITESNAQLSYGLSKMTVVNDAEGAQKYDSMVFVEFLEMIARTAVLKYKSTPFETENLQRKIEMTLDELLKVVGHQRKDIELDEEFDSVSDDQEADFYQI